MYIIFARWKCVSKCPFHELRTFLQWGFEMWTFLSEWQSEWSVVQQVLDKLQWWSAAYVEDQFSERHWLNHKRHNSSSLWSYAKGMDVGLLRNRDLIEWAVLEVNTKSVCDLIWQNWDISSGLKRTAFIFSFLDHVRWRGTEQGISNISSGV